MQLSIVTTLYRSAPYIKEFYERVSAAAAQLTPDYELIFVNDGSPDDSIERVKFLYSQDDRVKIVDLSRNFGHHRAIMTGLAHAQGDLVFLIDSDLEEEPEWLLTFHEELFKTSADVIYGVQETRKGGIFERLSGGIFYQLFNMLSTYPVPANLVTARLMTKRYVSALIQHHDREIFLAGLWAITGFEQRPLQVQKHNKGSTSYSLLKRLAAFVNAITSFSNRPLVFIFHLGLFIVCVSGLAACYLIVRRVFFGIYMEGWPSLIVSIWLLGGLTIFCVGVIGIYLSKIFTETKNRPYTIIREFYARESGPRLPVAEDKDRGLLRREAERLRHNGSRR